MMDFRNFEVLYGNALKMKNAASKIEKMSVRMTIQQAAQAAVAAQSPSAAILWICSNQISFQIFFL